MNIINLPWIEKYRPKTLDDMIDHEEKINTIRNLIKKNELPHLLFYGIPGCGKTSLILAIARELYGNEHKLHVLELNASDDRGIDIVRNKIPNFVKTKSNKLRLVILDEADAMTQDAQSALRRVMEKYINTSRFCLICNNFNKIIPGIKSRCAIMRFGILNATEVQGKIRQITDKEGVQITDEAITTLVNVLKDFRQILNTLQCLHYIRLGNSNIINSTSVNITNVDNVVLIKVDTNVNTNDDTNDNAKIVEDESEEKAEKGAETVEAETVEAETVEAEAVEAETKVEDELKLEEKEKETTESGEEKVEAEKKVDTEKIGKIEKIEKPENITTLIKYEPIQSDDIYAYLGKPSLTETQKIMSDMFTGEFQDTYNKLLQLFRENRWNILDLISQVGKQVISMEMKSEQKFYLYRNCPR